MRTLVLLLLVLNLAFGFAGLAQCEDDGKAVMPSTVSDFVTVIEANNDTQAITFIAGYLYGVDNGMFIMSPCYTGVNNETSVRQLLLIFSNFAQKNAKEWSEPNALPVIAVASLLDAYPCVEPAVDLESEGTVY